MGTKSDGLVHLIHLCMNSALGYRDMHVNESGIKIFPELSSCC
jgi:hypothetical protein